MRERTTDRPPAPRFRCLSAFYALANAREVNHQAARTTVARLANERRRLFTTNFIVAETHALCLTRLGRYPALRVLEEIDHGTIVIVRVSAGDERRAREIIRRYTGKDFSLTDATSFPVMERLRVAQAFSFDSDFHSTASW